MLLPAKTRVASNLALAQHAMVILLGRKQAHVGCVAPLGWLYAIKKD